MLSFLVSDLKRGPRVPMVMLAAALTAAPMAQASSVGGQGTWETTLQGRDLDGNAVNGFEAYYDTALDITWLNNNPNAMYVQWGAAQAWVTSLNVNGVTGWRLPTVVDAGRLGCDSDFFTYSGGDCGQNVDTSLSEMAHMHHVTLGNVSYSDTSGNGPQSAWGVSTNGGPFKSGFSGEFWTGTEYAPGIGSGRVWFYDFSFGSQYHVGKFGFMYAWAVHPGDVAAVPEPHTHALMLLGLAAVAMACKRRHHHARSLEP